jgi:hypothetical protein
LARSFSGLIRNNQQKCIHIFPHLKDRPGEPIMKIINIKKTRILKVAFSTSIIAVMLLSSMAIAPVNAADPTVNSDTWFVAYLTSASGAVKNFTSTTTHVEVNITWNVMRSPGVAGTVQIGTASSRMVFDFNNATNTGSVTYKMTMNLTETNSTKNPYGVGTLNVTVTAAVTSIGTLTIGVRDNPLDGKGTLVSTSGTGAFSTAKLYGDLVLAPLLVGPLTANGFTEALFFGTHARVNGNGVLVYYPALAASAFCSVTVMTGQTWYFFAQSTGGVGPSTYQWYEGTTLLTGQTSMILAMNKAAAGTYTYTCKVTDAYGNTANTNAVTLTVL